MDQLQDQPFGFINFTYSVNDSAYKRQSRDITTHFTSLFHHTCLFSHTWLLKLSLLTWRAWLLELSDIYECISLTLLISYLHKFLFFSISCLLFLHLCIPTYVPIHNILLLVDKQLLAGFVSRRPKTSKLFNKV